MKPLLFLLLLSTSFAQLPTAHLTTWDAPAEPVAKWRVYERKGTTPSFTVVRLAEIPYSATVRSFSVPFSATSAKRVLLLTAVAADGTESPFSPELTIPAAPTGFRVDGSFSFTITPQ